MVNAQTWQLAFGQSLQAREQHRGISADDLLARAKENFRHLAAVGVQEDMPTLAAAIASTLGLQIDVTRPRANTTKSRPDSSQISLETREKIHPLVSIDLALYEYVLTEYVFSARSRSVIAALAPIQDDVQEVENLTAEPEQAINAIQTRRLIPAGIRKAISINGIRRLAGV